MLHAVQALHIRVRVWTLIGVFVVGQTLGGRLTHPVHCRVRRFNRFRTLHRSVGSSVAGQDARRLQNFHTNVISQLTKVVVHGLAKPLAATLCDSFRVPFSIFRGIFSMYF